MPLDLAQQCTFFPAELLRLAIAAESAFLFRETACRLIGDPNYTVEDIKNKFVDIHPALLPLLLRKRQILQSLMDNIEKRVFTIQAWRHRFFDSKTIAIAAGAFRERIAAHFYAHRHDKWSSHATQFRDLKGSLTLCTLRNGSLRNSWYGSLHRHSYYSDIHEFYACVPESVFRSLASRAVAIIAPLFKSVVEESKIQTTKGQASREGFLCIDITEAEMSWAIEN